MTVNNNNNNNKKRLTRGFVFLNNLILKDNFNDQNIFLIYLQVHFSPSPTNPGLQVQL